MDDFELLESLLLEHGRFALTAGHLERMASSAARLGRPFDRERVLAVLRAVGAAHPAGRFKVRLCLAVDGGCRAEALALPDPSAGFGDGGRPLLIGLAGWPVDPADPFLRHKTTRREVYERAAGSRPECQEVVLYDPSGRLTETCRANLALVFGRDWLTPAGPGGFLPGVYRRELLGRGLVREAVLTVFDLAEADGVWLVNSVRGWMPARLAPGEAERIRAFPPVRVDADGRRSGTGGAAPVRAFPEGRPAGSGFPGP